MQKDLVLIFVVYASSLVWQVPAWVFLRRYAKKTPDQGWSFSRFVFLIILGLLVWNLGLFGVQANTIWTVLAFAVLILTVMFFTGDTKTKIPWKEIYLSEYLFLLGFLLLSIIRGYNPNIDNLEKFMDFGFINQYLKNSRVPGMDMWWAGSKINYYSFGHFIANLAIRLWGVSGGVGYNLYIGFLGGSTLFMASGLIHKLIPDEVYKKSRPAAIFGSVVGAMVMVFGGNGHLAWFFLKNLSFEKYWYADATRFIHNTIHEFPSYSFIVADLHAHLLGLPILIFVFFLIDWYKNKSAKLSLILGVILGLMTMTNTWDTLIYGILLSLFVISWIKKVKLRELLTFGLLVGTGFAVTSWGFFLNFSSITNGVFLVKTRSEFWQLIVLWWPVVPTVAAAIFLYIKEKLNLPLLLIVCTASVLILIPELVYVKDIYPDHPRANTMFKLTYQAFVLSSLGLGVVISQIKTCWIFVFGPVFICQLVYPLLGFSGFYNDFKNYKTINGEQWIDVEYPEKSRLIDYLRSISQDGNIVEAVGESYSKRSSVSVVSGKQTILGWRVHEWLWRGGFDKVSYRETQVRGIYESNDKDKVKSILKLYDVKWVVVGKDEKETYSIDDDFIKSLGDVVWQSSESYLVEVKAN